jgi:hypothetical protein
MASFSIIKRGEPHSILKTTEIALKIINQPSILHILVAFWVSFSNNNYKLTTFKDLYTKLPLCREMKTKNF